MEIKIHQAVYKKTETRNSPSDVNSLGKWALLLAKARPSSLKQHYQEDQAENTTEYSCFRKQLHVIIVHVIDDEPIIESLIPGIHRN